MKRIVVLGGSGFFGRMIVERLREMGLQPLAAARSRGDLRIDANDSESIQAHLRQRDLVIDAAGPFQKRTPALIDCATKIGFDLIDLSDSAAYTAMIYEHELPIRAAGIRVLTACSSLSTVSALVLKTSGIEQPRSVSAYLCPASRYTANAGAVESFLASIEGSPRTLSFPDPLGKRRGVTVRSVDAVTLPPVFPSLQTIEFVVDSGIAGANLLIRSGTARRLIERLRPAVLAIARRFGRKSGVLAYEIKSAQQLRHQIFTGENSYMLAVLPAILAAQAIAGGRFAHRGLVPPIAHVDPAEFLEAVRREGIAALV